MTFADKYRKTGINAGINAGLKTSTTLGSRYRKDSPSFITRPSTPQIENIPGLMGTTKLIKAPEKEWPLGFVGRMAKATFDFGKSTVENWVNRAVEATNKMGEYNLQDYNALAIKRGESIGTPGGAISTDQAAEELGIKKVTPLQRGVAMGQSAVATAQFHPTFMKVGAELSAARELPGPLSWPAKGVDWTLGKISEGGIYVMRKSVESLPITQETKDEVIPLAEEVGAFVAQIVTMELGMKVAKTGLGEKSTLYKKLPFSEKTKSTISTGVQLGVGFSMTPFSTAYGLASAKIVQKFHERQVRGIEITTEEGKKIIEEVKQELPEEIKIIVQNLTPTEVKIPVKVEQTFGEKYRKPIVGDVQFERSTKPGIEGKMKFVSKEPQPLAQEAGLARPKTKIEQEAQAQELGYKPDLAPREPAAKQITQEAKAQELGYKPTPPERLQSKVYQRIRDEFQQERGYTPEGMEKVLKYEEKNLQRETEKAIELIKTDKQKAFDIAMGKEPAIDVLSTSVSIALQERALADGNSALFSRLVKQRSLEQTRRGQEIVAERGSVKDNSTSRYVKELLASRLDKLGKGYLGGIENVIKRTTDKGKAFKKIDAEVAKMEKQVKSGKLDVKTALDLLDKLTCI